jgi:hypothetical protein
MTAMKIGLPTSVFVAIALTATIVNAEPQYMLNRDATATTALSNLSSGEGCFPARAAGTVVAVSYDEKQIIPVDFTLEEKTGDRTLINIDTPELRKASRVSQGWVVQGLQRMIREGRWVDLGIKLCGASGRVVMLDAITAR